MTGYADHRAQLRHPSPHRGRDGTGVPHHRVDLVDPPPSAYPQLVADDGRLAAVCLGVDDDDAPRPDGDVVDVGDRPRQPAVVEEPPAGSPELVEDRADDALALQPAGLALGLKPAGLRLGLVLACLQDQVVRGPLVLLGTREVALAHLLE